MAEDLRGTLAQRAVDRSLGDRRTQYADEIQRVLEATYDLIERTGKVDPSLRDILTATDLSTQAFYRYFQSKDELFLLLLDDGRRRLVATLERRMQRADTPEARVRAWIDGVLAQAADTRAAGRTRPFVTDQDRLAEAFPASSRRRSTSSSTSWPPRSCRCTGGPTRATMPSSCTAPCSPHCATT